ARGAAMVERNQITKDFLENAPASEIAAYFGAQLIYGVAKSKEGEVLANAAGSQPSGGVPGMAPKVTAAPRGPVYTRPTAKPSDIDEVLAEAEATSRNRTRPTCLGASMQAALSAQLKGLDIDAIAVVQKKPFYMFWKSQAEYNVADGTPAHMV